jgi:hypothetical protein
VHQVLILAFPCISLAVSGSSGFPLRREGY